MAETSCAWRWATTSDAQDPAAGISVSGKEAAPGSRHEEGRGYDGEHQAAQDHLRDTGSVEPAFGMGDTNGQKHEVVKEAVMRRRFLPHARLVLLCGGLIALGATTAEAAGIGVHLRGHAQNIPRAVAGGDTTRMSAWEQARRHPRD